MNTYHNLFFLVWPSTPAIIFMPRCQDVGTQTLLVCGSLDKVKGSSWLSTFWHSGWWWRKNLIGCSPISCQYILNKLHAKGLRQKSGAWSGIWEILYTVLLQGAFKNHWFQIQDQFLSHQKTRRKAVTMVPAIRKNTRQHNNVIITRSGSLFVLQKCFFLGMMNGIETTCVCNTLEKSTEF